MDHSDSAPATTPAKAQRVLVLQGGGALGSYQAGAFQALCRSGFEPEWIAGISIGAINAAIIAGNGPETRVDRINDLKTRLSVGAVGVSSGNFRYFDNFEFRKLGKKIGPEHIMASGALPPGFPSVEIEGEHYWDGGIASNTPLDHVLGEESNRDLLIFQVDLFSARGLLPESLLEAAEREKDIRFSSRTRMNTDKNRQIHEARKAVRDSIGKLPDDVNNDPSDKFLRQAAKEHTVTVVHLIYKSKNYESSSKDYDFSHVGMVEHWSAGVRDVHLSMRHTEWLERPQSDETMVTYDLTRDGSETLDGKQE